MQQQNIEKDEPIKNHYNSYVKEITPTTCFAKNLCFAFLIGGGICLLGQILIEWFVSMGYEREEAGMWQMIIFVLVAVLLTGFGLYSKIAKYAGAGTLVPITGFANSVASPAIEFKEEGQVFGIGCRIFSIAGPVILYGTLSSWCLGFLYWLGKVMGIF